MRSAVVGVVVVNGLVVVGELSRAVLF